MQNWNKFLDNIYFIVMYIYLDIIREQIFRIKEMRPRGQMPNDAIFLHQKNIPNFDARCTVCIPSVGYAIYARRQTGRCLSYNSSRTFISKVYCTHTTKRESLKFCRRETEEKRNNWNWMRLNLFLCFCINIFSHYTSIISQWNDQLWSQIVDVDLFNSLTSH